MSSYDKSSHGVVDVHFSVGQREEEKSRVRRPADAGQLSAFQLLAPNPVSVNGSDYDGAIL